MYIYIYIYIWEERQTDRQSERGEKKKINNRI